jgi:glycosyltransferase involved in cell wall biosynthesis
MGTGGGTTVLHSMQRWLPLSEQFVHALVTGTAHPGVVVSRFPLEHTDAFPFAPVHSLDRLVPRAPARRHALERRLVTVGLLALAARHRVGLVHHHHGYRMRDPEGLVIRRDLPFVVSFHGEDVTTYLPAHAAYYAGIYERLSAVIVPSQFLVGPTVALGVDADRVHVIPSGVDSSFFAPTPLPDIDSPEVVFVGRFVEKKGLDVLLTAWPRVRERVPEAVLRLVGFGPLEDLVRGAGPGVVVELARSERRAEQVRDAIRRASVVVTPSRTAVDGDAETLLLVNLEAQASGRPLVTTRHGGIPEFVSDGETAILVDENDADGLADAITTVLLDGSLARSMAAAGPAWAARFDVKAGHAQVDALYDRLLS